MKPKQQTNLLGEPLAKSAGECAVVRVFLVEDETEVRARLCVLIESDPRLRLVGCADRTASARRWLSDSRHRLDVMLVDLGLPDGSGLDLIAECKNLRPQVSIMVMTMFSDPGHVFTALERGASGYLLKSADGAALAEQVLDLHNGGSPITPTVARLVVQRLSKQLPSLAPEADGANPVQTSGEALTAREVNVLNLISIGYSYAEISNQLHISKHTVNAHIRSSYQKLQVNSRSEAVFEGHRRGLLSTPKR